jgi:hypothetical protein
MTILPILSRSNKALIANIGGAHSVQKLRRDIRRHKPIIVVVSEAYFARKFLNSFPAYTNLQLPLKVGQTREALGVAVLIRDNSDILSTKPLRMTKFWHGPFHGKLHSPRTYLKGRITTPQEMKLRFLGVHFPSGGPDGPNKLAWNESKHTVDKWRAHFPNISYIALGDWNATITEMRVNFKNTQIWQGGKVDHFMTSGIKKKKVIRLKPPVGMHGWFVFKFKVNN